MDALTPKQNQHIRDLCDVLLKNSGGYAAVVPKSFLEQPPFIFNFTENNSGLGQLNAADLETFSKFINSALKKSGNKMGAGGYGESRVLYASKLFKNESESRSVHLAVDLWLPEGTKVCSPLPGKIHSFHDNNNFLDYGPTIILEHELDSIILYTLYGHLNRKSLLSLSNGKNIGKGESFARLGNSSENGSWPPHLHFQVISDMLGKQGDFPGVAKPSEKDYYLSLCPNPNLILQIPSLP